MTGVAAGVWTLAAPGEPLPAFKIYVEDDGVYAVRFEELVAAGLPAGAGPLASARLAVTHRGEPVPVHVADGGDGRFGPGDRIELVAEHLPGEGSYYSHHSRFNVYRLTLDGEAGTADDEGEPAAERNAPAGGGRPAGRAVLLARHHLEEDRLFLRFGPKHRRDPPDPWYWARLTHIDREPFRHLLRVPWAATAGRVPVTLAVELRGWSYQPKGARTGLPDHRVELRLNDRLVAVGEWDGQEAHRIEVAEVPSEALRPGPNAIELRVPPRRPAGSAEPLVDAVALDWIEVSHAAGPALGEAQQRLEPATAGGEGAGPAAPPAVVLRATAPPQVFAAGGGRLTVEETGKRRGGRRAFRVAMPAGETALWAVPEGALLSAARVEIDRPSDLRRTDLQTDYLMIAHPTLRATVEPLAALHRSRGLRVRLVEVDDVYDEFSHGIVDPRAIRDFLDYARRSYPPPAPRFVLLVGDASWDVRSPEAEDANYADWTFQGGAVGRGLRKNLSTAYADDRPRNLVPTGSYFSDQGHAASDNWFVSLTPPSHFPDLAIGRLPASDPEEVAAVVAKIVRYVTSPEAGDWRRRVLWVSERGQRYQQRVDDLAREAAAAGLTSTRIPPDGDLPPRPAGASDDPGRRLREAFDAGHLLVHFHGHGGRYIWRTASSEGGRQQDLFGLDDLDRLAPTGRLPLVLSMTCYSAPFDHPTADSIGEKFLRLPDRGAIAVLAASWRSDPDPAFSQALVRELLAGDTIEKSQRTTRPRSPVSSHNSRSAPSSARSPACKPPPGNSQ